MATLPPKNGTTPDSTAGRVSKDAENASPELAKELQDFVKRTTAPHKYPRAVIFVDSLPKTATGKIQRFELRERAAEETPLHRR